MEKVINKFSSFKEEQEAEFEYWAQRSHDERLESLLEILSLVEPDETEITPRVERFFKISPLGKS